MLRVGLTGGIACGKSTVARMLRELGCHIIDDDKIAHRLIDPGASAYDDVVREFGRGILDSDGRVDRQKLGSIVFADPGRLARLNAIIHPRVLEAQEREVAAIEKTNPHTIVFIEAALLIEAGYHERLDCLVVAWCTAEQQMARLTNPVGTHANSGRGLTSEQAAQRIASQLSLDEKRRTANEEIDCSGSLEHTREQVVALVSRLKQRERERVH